MTVYRRRTGWRVAGRYAAITGLLTAIAATAAVATAVVLRLLLT